MGFERMTESQKRLAKEIGEFEDAKKFYEKKLSNLRDRMQDNSIHFWEYEKRINEITKIYEKDTNGKKLGEWENKPNIKYSVDEESRVSITYGKKRESSGWGAFTPSSFNMNKNGKQNEV